MLIGVYPFLDGQGRVDSRQSEVVPEEVVNANLCALLTAFGMENKTLTLGSVDRK